MRALVSGHLGNTKVFKEAKPSCLGASHLLASWPLLYGREGELWRELFGHQGADGVLGAYDESQNTVLVAQSWLHTDCDCALATSKIRSVKEVV